MKKQFTVFRILTVKTAIKSVLVQRESFDEEIDAKRCIDEKFNTKAHPEAVYTILPTYTKK